MTEEIGDHAALHREELIEKLKADAHAAYDRREEEVGEEVMRELERRVLLSVLDRKWREHLYEMDYLREGIYLRAYSQRDPLVEYQREGYDMFAAMMDGIKEETVGFLFNLEVQVEDDEPEFHYHADGSRHEGPMHEGALAEPPRRRRGGRSGPRPDLGGAQGRSSEDEEQRADASRAAVTGRARTSDQGEGPGGAEAAPVPVLLGAERRDRRARGPRHHGRPTPTTSSPTIGRNQLCPCGSGKKYKRCHGAPGGPSGLTARVS